MSENTFKELIKKRIRKGDNAVDNDLSSDDGKWLDAFDTEMQAKKPIDLKILSRRQLIFYIQTLKNEEERKRIIEEFEIKIEELKEPPAEEDIDPEFLASLENYKLENHSSQQHSTKSEPRKGKEGKTVYIIKSRTITTSSTPSTSKKIKKLVPLKFLSFPKIPEVVKKDITNKPTNKISLDVQRIAQSPLEIKLPLKEHCPEKELKMEQRKPSEDITNISPEVQLIAQSSVEIKQTSKEHCLEKESKIEQKKDLEERINSDDEGSSSQRSITSKDSILSNEIISIDYDEESCRIIKRVRKSSTGKHHSISIKPSSNYMTNDYERSSTASGRSSINTSEIRVLKRSTSQQTVIKQNARKMRSPATKSDEGSSQKKKIVSRRASISKSEETVSTRSEYDIKKKKVSKSSKSKSETSRVKKKSSLKKGVMKQGAPKVRSSTRKSEEECSQKEKRIMRSASLAKTEEPVSTPSEYFPSDYDIKTSKQKKVSKSAISKSQKKSSKMKRVTFKSSESDVSSQISSEMEELQKKFLRNFRRQSKLYKKEVSSTRAKPNNNGKSKKRQVLKSSQTHKEFNPCVSSPLARIRRMSSLRSSSKSQLFDSDNLSLLKSVYPENISQHSSGALSGTEPISSSGSSRGFSSCSCSQDSINQISDWSFSKSSSSTIEASSEIISINSENSSDTGNSLRMHGKVGLDEISIASACSPQLVKNDEGNIEKPLLPKSNRNDEDNENSTDSKSKNILSGENVSVEQTVHYGPCYEIFPDTSGSSHENSEFIIFTKDNSNFCDENNDKLSIPHDNSTKMFAENKLIPFARYLAKFGKVISFDQLSNGNTISSTPLFDNNGRRVITYMSSDDEQDTDLGNESLLLTDTEPIQYSCDVKEGDITPKMIKDDLYKEREKNETKSDEGMALRSGRKKPRVNELEEKLVKLFKNLSFIKEETFIYTEEEFKSPEEPSVTLLSGQVKKFKSSNISKIVHRAFSVKKKQGCKKKNILKKAGKQKLTRQEKLLNKNANTINIRSTPTTTLYNFGRDCIPAITRSVVEPPKGTILCGMECGKPKSYTCTATGVPICSLKCYRKNLSLHTKSVVQDYSVDNDIHFMYLQRDADRKLYLNVNMAPRNVNNSPNSENKAENDSSYSD